MYNNQQSNQPYQPSFPPYQQPYPQQQYQQPHDQQQFQNQSYQPPYPPYQQPYPQQQYPQQPHDQQQFQQYPQQQYPQQQPYDQQQFQQYPQQQYQYPQYPPQQQQYQQDVQQHLMQTTTTPLSSAPLSAATPTIPPTQQPVQSSVPSPAVAPSTRPLPTARPLPTPPGVASMPTPTKPTSVPTPTAPVSVPTPTAPTSIPEPTQPTSVPTPTAPASVPMPTAPTSVPTPTPILPPQIPSPTPTSPTPTSPTPTMPPSSPVIAPTSQAPSQPISSTMPHALTLKNDPYAPSKILQTSVNPGVLSDLSSRGQVYSVVISAFGTMESTFLLSLNEHHFVQSSVDTVDDGSYKDFLEKIKGIRNLIVLSGIPLTASEEESLIENFIEYSKLILEMWKEHVDFVPSKQSCRILLNALEALDEKLSAINDATTHVKKASWTNLITCCSVLTEKFKERNTKLASNESGGGKYYVSTVTPDLVVQDEESGDDTQQYDSGGEGRHDSEDDGENKADEKNESDNEGNQDSEISDQSESGKQDTVDSASEDINIKEKSNADEVVKVNIEKSSEFWTRQFWKLDTDSADNVSDWKALIDGFTIEAALIGKQIINEKHIPNNEKLVKQFNSGGLAGGIKYLAKGLFIKFPEDKEVAPGVFVYGGETKNDLLAAKACNHDIKGWTNLYAASKDGDCEFLYPLLILVDYCGFRLVISSQLPISNGSLCYGTSDGGKTIHAEPDTHRKMKTIAEKLNLKLHNVLPDDNEPTEVAICADLEVHKVDVAENGEKKSVVLDWARTFPPQFPLKDFTSTSIFSHLLRPELVKAFKSRLSSDALSGFDRDQASSIEVRDATVFLIKTVLKDFISTLTVDVNKKYITGIDSKALQEPIIVDMHAKGINIRFLGRIWLLLQEQKPTNYALISFIFTIIFVRAVKNIWRTKIQGSENETKTGKKRSILDICRKQTKVILNQITQKNTDLLEEVKKVLPTMFGIQDNSFPFVQKLWKMMNTTLVIHKVSKLCGIELAPEVREKLKKFPQTSISDAEIVDFIPIKKYPAILDYHVGCFWLDKSYKTVIESHKIQYMAKAAEKFSFCLASYEKTLFREKYFEAMLNLFKLDPYYPLCDPKQLCKWLSEKMFKIDSNFLQPPSFTDELYITFNGKTVNITLDLLFCLCFTSNDKNLPKGLDILLGEQLPNPHLIHIEYFSSSFLSSFNKKFPEVVEEFVISLKKITHSHNQHVLLQVLDRFSVSYDHVPIALTKAHLLDENVIEQYEIVSKANLSAPASIEKFVDQIWHEVANNKYLFSEEGWKLIQTMALLPQKETSEKMRNNIIKSLILLSKDARDCFEGKEFGWKCVVNKYNLHSMWFYILKLIKSAEDPVKEIGEILDASVKYYNNILFVTLFEVIMFATTYVPRLSNDKQINKNLRARLTELAKGYSQEIQYFFQVDDPVVETAQWKEGFVEIFQYYLYLQPEVGWEIVKELYKPFASKDPGYGFALVRILIAAVPTLFPGDEIEKWKELQKEYDALGYVVPEATRNLLAVPVLDKKNTIATSPLPNLDLYSSGLAEKGKNDNFNLPNKDVLLVARILNTTKDVSLQELSLVLPAAFEKSSKKESQIKYLNFLQLLISNVPFSTILEKCAHYFFTHLLPVDKEVEYLFKNVFMHYLGLMPSKSATFIATLKRHFDSTWLSCYKLEFKHFKLQELITEGNLKKFVLELEKSNFANIHYSLKPLVFEIFQANEPTLYKSKGESMLTELYLLSHFETISKLKAISLHTLFEIIPNENPVIENFALPFVVKCLLDAGYNIEEIQDEDSKIRLMHSAAKFGHTAVVSLLLSRGAKLDPVDDDKETPLHHALYYGWTKLVKFLVHKGANKEHKDSSKCTPLLKSCSVKGNSEIFEFLLEAGCNENVVDDSKETPLIAACSAGLFPVVQKLIERGASINAVDDNKSTPLHNAAYQGHLNIVTYLLEKGANIEAKNKQEETPLLSAASKMHLAVMKLLIEKGANTKATNDEGADLFYIVSESHSDRTGSLDVLKFVLGLGFSVNTKNKDKYTPLHWASELGKVTLARFLLENGADKNAKDKKNKTPLDVAEEDNTAIVDLLNNFGTNTATAISTAGGKSATISDEKKEFKKELVLSWIRAPSDAFSITYFEPLYQQNPSFFISSIVDDSCQYTLLHYAAKIGHASVVSFLLAHGANIEAKDINGETPLFLAINKGKAAAIVALLEYGANVKVENNDKETPLHYAAYAYNGNRIVSMLIERGANVNAVDKDSGNTPLLNAVSVGNMNSIIALVEKNADINIANKTKECPLHCAAQDGILPAISLFLEKGAPIDAQTTNLRTPLIFAAMYGKLDATKLLISKGCQLNIADKSGNTALHHAVQQNNLLAIVKLLVEKGANSVLKNNEGKTPLDIAKDKKRNQIVTYLTSVNSMEPSGSSGDAELDALLETFNIPEASLELDLAFLDGLDTW